MGGLDKLIKIILNVVIIIMLDNPLPCGLMVLKLKRINENS